MAIHRKIFSPVNTVDITTWLAQFGFVYSGQDYSWHSIKKHDTYMQMSSAFVSSGFFTIYISAYALGGANKDHFSTIQLPIKAVVSDPISTIEICVYENGLDDIFIAFNPYTSVGANMSDSAYTIHFVKTELDRKIVFVGGTTAREIIGTTATIVGNLKPLVNTSLFNVGNTAYIGDVHLGTETQLTDERIINYKGCIPNGGITVGNLYMIDSKRYLCTSSNILLKC